MADDGFVSMADTLQVRVDGNLIRIRNQRYLTLRDLNVVVGIYNRVHAEHGPFFVVYDVTQSEGVDRAARNALASSSNLPGPNPAVTAIFGASFAVRTVANMIERARVGLGQVPTGMRFFQTEAQALVHIDEQRHRIQAKS